MDPGARREGAYLAGWMVVRLIKINQSWNSSKSLAGGYEERARCYQGNVFGESLSINSTLRFFRSFFRVLLMLLLF